MLGKYKITINFDVEIEKINNSDTDPEQDSDFYSENDSEFGSDSDDYLNGGCKCYICNPDSSEDSDSENSDSNEDDDLDYSKYSSDNYTPTGWSYTDEQEYNRAWDKAVREANSLYPLTPQRNQSGQFAKGNTPTAKRGPGGRFVKSN